jgi:hypothetical protein
MQVEFMRRIALTIDDELRRVLDELLYQFAMKLSLAVTKLESVLKKESEARPGFLGFGSRATRRATCGKRKHWTGS